LIGFGKSPLSEVLIAISPITSIYCALVPMSEDVTISPLRVVLIHIFTSAVLLTLFGGLLLSKRNAMQRSLALQTSPVAPQPSTSQP
jgi:hypothetical protein